MRGGSEGSGDVRKESGGVMEDGWERGSRAETESRSGFLHEGGGGG